jgi:hypothetical protein
VLAKPFDKVYAIGGFSTEALALERETKNTIRYQKDADGKAPAIGTLYVQKWLLGKEPPRTLVISIEEET